MRIDPHHAIALANRGSAWGEKGEYAKAIEDYDAALAADPKNIRLHVNRGHAFAESGDMDRAIDDYTEALSLDPRNAEAYARRAAAFRPRAKTSGLNPTSPPSSSLKPRPISRNVWRALTRVGEITISWPNVFCS